MTRRIYLLLEWDADLGAATDLVGVLGLENAKDPVVEWIPWHPNIARWHARLAQDVDPAKIEEWLEQDATLAIAPAPEPGPGMDLRTAVAVALDTRLAAPSAVRERG